MFSDYLRPTLRLAAIMELPVIHIYTHDSIGVGEDGPTHQPVEHYAALRAIPRLLFFRPGDANEVAETYRTVLKLTNRPAALSLTRQNLPTLDRTKYARGPGVAQGGYVLADAAGGKPDVSAAGHGQRIAPGRRGARKADGRGREVARGQLPLLRTVRRAAARVSR